MLIHDSVKNCEWRISIYGRQRDEWDKLAKWIVNNKLFSHNVRWLIQIPRLYDVYKHNGSINTFEDIVRSKLPSWLGNYADSDGLHRRVRASI